MKKLLLVLALASAALAPTGCNTAPTARAWRSSFGRTLTIMTSKLRSFVRIVSESVIAKSY